MLHCRASRFFSIERASILVGNWSFRNWKKYLRNLLKNLERLKFSHFTCNLPPLQFPTKILTLSIRKNHEALQCGVLPDTFYWPPDIALSFLSMNDDKAILIEIFDLSLIAYMYDIHCISNPICDRILANGRRARSKKRAADQFCWSNESDINSVVMRLWPSREYSPLLQDRVKVVRSRAWKSLRGAWQGLWMPRT